MKRFLGLILVLSIGSALQAAGRRSALGVGASNSTSSAMVKNPSLRSVTLAIQQPMSESASLGLLPAAAPLQSSNAAPLSGAEAAPVAPARVRLPQLPPSPTLVSQAAAMATVPDLSLDSRLAEPAASMSGVPASALEVDANNLVNIEKHLLNSLNWEYSRILSSKYEDKKNALESAPVSVLSLPESDEPSAASSSVSSNNDDNLVYIESKLLQRGVTYLQILEKDLQDKISALKKLLLPASLPEPVPVPVDENQEQEPDKGQGSDSSLSTASAASNEESASGAGMSGSADS